MISSKKVLGIAADEEEEEKEQLKRVVGANKNQQDPGNRNVRGRTDSFEREQQPPTARKAALRADSDCEMTDLE